MENIDLVSDFGFQVQDSRVGISDFGLRVSASGFKCKDVRFRVSCSGIRGKDLCVRVSGFKYRVEGQEFLGGLRVSVFDLRF